MKKLIVVLSLALLGCESKKDAKTFTEKVKAFVGIGEKEVEDVEVTKKKLKEADDLVLNYATKLNERKNPSGGFFPAEGARELDPWGVPLHVSYEQDKFEQILVVASSGPDKELGTEDDIIRTHRASNRMEFYKGFGVWGYILPIWIGIGLAAFLFRELTISIRKKGRVITRHWEKTFIILLGCIFLAPLFLIFYIIVPLFALIGQADFDGGWEIGSFDIDF